MDGVGPKRILITGGSSGIGAALARAYAAPGVTLYLGGRDPGRLEAIAEICRDQGAATTTRCQDVTDRRGMATWISEAGPLDLVIANAGISGGTGGTEKSTEKSTENPDNTMAVEDPAQAREIIAINIDGVVNTIFPALDGMLARAAPNSGIRGQIAIMSSLAGFRGLPGAPAYGASKAAVRSWGEGLRGLLAPQGIKVSVICPGFIESPMTMANPYPMPFIMPSDRAAKIIKNGLARNRARIAFPWRLAAIVWFMTALPPSWLDPVVRRFPRKPAVRN